MEEQIFEQMTEMFAEIGKLSPVISAIGIAVTAFCVLYMHYAAQYRNKKLGMGWYICGVIFGPWAVLIFLLKRKEFPGPDLKECPSCGNKCPVNYEICNRCLVEFPLYNHEEKPKQKKLSKIFGIGIIVTYIISCALGSVMAVKMVQGMMGLIEDFASYNYRIAVDGVYYDKKGNSYENGNDVLLYGKDGTVYTYTEVPVNEDGYEYSEYYYVGDDGKKYYELDCYVTEDGWFYCDKGGLLELYFPDTENMTDEELDEYYDQRLELDDAEYKYYNNYYVDKKGNIYYNAYEASWNEKGELITAENDPTLNAVATTAATE